MKILLTLMVLLYFPACKSKLTSLSRQYSPDKDRYVELMQDSAEKTQSLWLGQDNASKRLLLAEGLPSMCGVGMDWLPSGELQLRLPEPYRKFLRAEASGKLRVEFHEDGVTKSVASPDRRWRVIAVKNCENAAWELHLRAKGEPNFDGRMQEGWGDPTLLCAFDHRRILKSIRWLGPAKVLIEIRGPRAGATLRDSASGINFEWKFLKPSLNG